MDSRENVAGDGWQRLYVVRSSQADRLPRHPKHDAGGFVLGDGRRPWSGREEAAPRERVAESVAL
jgi:hypothetical protein